MSEPITAVLIDVNTMKVVNRILVKSNNGYTPPAGQMLIETEIGAIGQDYNNGVFSWPEGHRNAEESLESSEQA